MDYHMHYPANAADPTTEAPENVPVSNGQREERLNKRKYVMIGAYLLFFVLFLLSLCYCISIRRYKALLKNEVANELDIANADSDVLIRSLLNSKKGKQFILSKLEELIVSYSSDMNFNEKNEEKYQNISMRKHMRNRYGKEDDSMVKDSDKERTNNENSVVKSDDASNDNMVEPLYENGKISNVVFLLDNLDAVTSFDDFSKSFKRNYKDMDEKHIKFTNYMNNYLKIKKHNNMKNVLFQKKINHFGDMSFEEIRSKILRFNPFKSITMNTYKSPFFNDESTSILIDEYKKKTMNFLQENYPDEFAADNDDTEQYDWRKFNVSTNIKNQGLCGSCWAFSAVAAVESQYMIRKKEKVSLSEQQLIDCSSMNHGCQGGFMIYAYEYVLDAGGFCTEEQYPYLGMEQSHCLLKKCTNVYPITRVKEIAPNRLKEAIRHIGPVSADIAVSEDFVFYSDGIFDGECEEETNHAILIVGYGKGNIYDENDNTNKTVYYYIIKNSWGSNWGENGYMNIITNKDGTYRKCSLGNTALIALIDNEF